MVSWVIAVLLLGISGILVWLCSLLMQLLRVLERASQEPSGLRLVSSTGPASGRPSPPGDELPRVSLEELESQTREALTQSHWDEANRLIEQIRLHPDPDNLRQADRLRKRWREEQILQLGKQIDASRAANDPTSVLTLHARLSPLLQDDSRTENDRELVNWFMKVLMKRMRTGTVSEDVPLLAEHVAERFPHTREGASLKASLGTLRRSAGLCPTCTQKYTGVEKACPECLASRKNLSVPISSAIPTSSTSAEGNPTEVSGPT